jgi:hypothetical protein
MSLNEDHPDRRLVEDFLLGRLADAEAERVAALVAADMRWQALAEAAPHSDPLVEAVQDSASQPASDDTPLLRDLMERLEGLSLHSAATRSHGGGTDTSGPAGAASDAADLPFLRAAEAPDELGRLNGFRILQVLGRGGMGLVLRAEDVRLRRQVALKVIKPERAADPSHRERFLREARAAAALHHDHVMPIHQVGEDNGVLFLAMPLLAGETLEDRLRRDGRLPVAEVLRIGREAAEGLAAAHAAGVIHRDVKPSNIWVEQASGRVRLLDFGLARFAKGDEGMTLSGVAIGTPAYMSPEQADGLPLDARSDLFSLGCVLYRMASGTQPFTRGSMTATLRAIADHQPAAPAALVPDIPHPLSDLILRLLAKKPEDRPASAAATAAALRAMQGGDVTVAEPRPLPARRRRGCAITITVTVAVLAALVIGPFALFYPAVKRIKARAPLGSPPETVRESGPPAPELPPPASDHGSVDGLVWRKADGKWQRLRLSEDGALPLSNGDKYRIEAVASPAAYLYLFLIDSEGEANPLYPWQPGKWGTRPQSEEKQIELSLPKTADQGWTVNGAGSGMWTLLLLERDTPWDVADDDIRGLFAGLPPQRPVQNERSAVWFENGQVVKNDDRRRAVWFEATGIDDPVLRVQALLRQKLQPHARFTAAVSFAKRGK